MLPFRLPLVLVCVLIVAAMAMPGTAATPGATQASVQSPMALWVPFEVTTPAGAKTRLMLVPSQYADRFVLLTPDFQAWHLVPADGNTPGPIPTPSPTPQPPVPSPNPYQPAPQYLTLVEPVRKIVLSRQDAETLAKVYGSLSVDVAQTGAAWSTNGDLRAELVKRGQTLALKGKYPGLGVAIDGVLAKVLTLENAALDRQKASDLLRTLAWIVWETGK